MPPLPRESFRLWDGPAPGALGDAEEAHVPTLTPHWPDPARATGASVVVCPGGSYMMLADHEGTDYAVWLAERGIAAFVLKYRLGSSGYRHPAMLSDAARAVRTIRRRARDWALDPARIGVMGSSAGGHLVSTIVTQFDAGAPGSADPVERESSRPDLGILCYPVISMGPLGHGESRRNLLGPDPAPGLVELLSSESRVTPATPPCFLFHTQADEAVPVENTLCFAAALQASRVPFSLHVYPSGPHGVGLGAVGYRPGDPRPLHPWTHELHVWLHGMGFAQPPGPAAGA